MNKNFIIRRNDKIEKIERNETETNLNAKFEKDLEDDTEIEPLTDFYSIIKSELDLIGK